MRDHEKLRVFALADELVLSVYRETASLPRSEQFGLTTQMRRAAVSITANIVEGCARSTHQKYCRFLDIAYGSARELEYEMSVCIRLGYLSETAGPTLLRQCEHVSKSICSLLRALIKSSRPTFPHTGQ